MFFIDSTDIYLLNIINQINNHELIDAHSQ